MAVIERRYGIAGKAAGEAALEYGAGRKATDAFVLSRIARAVVDALEADDRGAVSHIEALIDAGDDATSPHAEYEEHERWKAHVERARDFLGGQ